jgi:hypothetical protein
MCQKWANFVIVKNVGYYYSFYSQKPFNTKRFEETVAPGPVPDRIA